MTRIAWTNATWNPVSGCKKISPGCSRCFAMPMARRLKGMRRELYQHVVHKAGWTGKVSCNTAMLNKIPTKSGTNCFPCSMCDLFYEERPYTHIDQVFDRMIVNPQVTYQVLTKRPIRLYDYMRFRNYDRLPLIPNIWFGVSVESQAYMGRITDLGNVPAVVRFVSFEPLLEDVNIDLFKLIGLNEVIQWAIIGPESGISRRPCKIEWMVDLVKQLRATGIAVFVKAVPIDGKIVDDFNKFPPELQFRDYPKCS